TIRRRPDRPTAIATGIVGTPSTAKRRQLASATRAVQSPLVSSPRSEDPVIAALQDHQPVSFQPIIEAYIKQQMIEAGTVVTHEFDDRARIRQTLEEQQQLVDIDPGKIDAVVVALVRNTDCLALAQPRNQN